MNEVFEPLFLLWHAAARSGPTANIAAAKLPFTEHSFERRNRSSGIDASGQQDPAQLAVRIVDHAAVIIKDHSLATGRIARRPG